MNAPVARRPHSSRDLVSAPGSTNLADLLERVLDKGVVIAGEIVISLGSVELLTLKVRLLIASIDKAREIGIDWWETDPFLSSHAREKELGEESDILRKRLDRLERLLLAPPQEGDQVHAEAAQWSDAGPAYVLDKQGKVIAELKPPLEQAQEEEQPPTQERAPQPAEQPQEEERPHAPERAPQAEVAPAQQPAGAGPLVDQARHERIAQAEHLAQAMQPALEELRRPNAQAWQPGEQARPQRRHEEEQPQEQEQPRAPQAEAAPAEQPTGAGPVLGPALHERIAQAMRPVLEGLPQRIAQAWQPGEQAQPEGWHEEEQPHEQPQAPQLEAAQNPAPARVLEEEGRTSATPRPGRVTWRLAVVDLDRQGRVIAEPKQPVEQAQEDEQNAAPAYILDKQGRVIAELEQPVEQAQEDEGLQAPAHAPQPADQPQEEEQPHAPERAPQAEVVQAEQPAGAGPLLAPAVHAHIARAMQSVLEEVRQRNAQARQPEEQTRPVGRQDKAQPQQHEPPHALERAAQPEAAQTPAPASILDQQSRLITELKRPLERAQEDEGLQAAAHARQLQAAPAVAPAQQPAGAGPLRAPALHAHLARAMQSVLEEVRQRNAQARQPEEQARPIGRQREGQPQQHEPPHALERAAQPEAAPAQQPAPAGTGPLLTPALHAHITQAMRPVLEEVRQRNAQARPEG